MGGPWRQQEQLPQNKSRETATKGQFTGNADGQALTSVAEPVPACGPSTGLQCARVLSSSSLAEWGATGRFLKVQNYRKSSLASVWIILCFLLLFPSSELREELHVLAKPNDCFINIYKSDTVFLSFSSHPGYTLFGGPFFPSLQLLWRFAGLGGHSDFDIFLWFACLYFGSLCWEASFWSI